MKDGKKVDAIAWTARIFSILFTLFITMFAFDVFTEGASLKEMIIGFTMHLIPTFVLIFVLAVAWKHKLPGGILYIAASLLFVIMTKAVAVILYVPVFVIGLLYIISWYKEKHKIRED